MTDAEIRGTLLKVFYDLRHNAGGWVPTSDMNVSGVERQVIGAVCEQLRDGGLIQWKPLIGAHEGFVIGMGKITAIGVDVVDGATRSPIAIQFREPVSTAHGPDNAEPTGIKPSAGQKPMVSQPPAEHRKSMEYDVALSFAGEDREYVDRVARGLELTDLRGIAGRLRSQQHRHAVVIGRHP